MSIIRPDLPLIDLHRHLDGSVRLETILDVGLQHNLPLPARDLEGLRPFVQVTTPVPGLLAFLEKFEWMVGILVNYDVCRRIAYENVQDAQREGIDYIELRFSPMFMAQPHGLDPAGIVEAVADGVAAGQRDFGVRTNLIGIISRTFGADMGWQELEALLSQRDHLVALDLAGDEVNFPGELFVEHFKRGRDAGWELMDVALQCLQKNPDDRPMADEIVTLCGMLCYSIEPRAEGVIRRIDYGAYGFIETEGPDVFFHTSSVYGPRLVQVGANVIFASYDGGGARRAHPVVVVDAPQA